MEKEVVMGTRIVGFVDYHLPAEAVSEPIRAEGVLASSTSACLDVERYWRMNDPQSEPNLNDRWRIAERGAINLPGTCFEGPGAMWIRFHPQVAEIRAGARWRGLLTIPALRQVHRVAFRAIAQTLAATGILFVPCYAEELLEAAGDGASLDGCLDLMEAKWGPMQGDLDDITARVVNECDHCPPKVWYLELL